MGIIEKMRLDGKKGFVTGAARGIGKCTATAFAEAGADVAIVDLDIEEAKKTAAELAEKTGRKVIAIQTDCTNKEQVDEMVETVVKELGGLDFCHNNAGICINAPAEEIIQLLDSAVSAQPNDATAAPYILERGMAYDKAGKQRKGERKQGGHKIISSNFTFLLRACTS